MTVPGSNPPDKPEDKEKLVQDDVGKILPTRIRLVRAQKTRLLTKLIVLISVLFLVLIGIFLTVCYLRRIGPFYRKVHGFCGVGNGPYNRRRAYESYEITDDYAFLNVPRFSHHRERFNSVKTLHVFQPKLTIIQYKNFCFVKRMEVNFNFHRHDWYDRLNDIKKRHIVLAPPYKFRYWNYRIEKPALSPHYMKNIHSLAAALCHNKPVFYLKIMKHPIIVRRRPNHCYRPCVSWCPLSQRSYIKQGWCFICKCRNVAVPAQARVTETIPRQKLGSQHHDADDNNCKTIKCEKICDDSNNRNCTVCKCIERDVSTHQPPTENSKAMKKVEPVANDFRISPEILTSEKMLTNRTKRAAEEKSKSSSGDDNDKFQDKSKPVVVESNGNGEVPASNNGNIEVFQDKSKPMIVESNGNGIEVFQDKSKPMIVESDGNRNKVFRDESNGHGHVIANKPEADPVPPLSRPKRSIDVLKNCRQIGHFFEGVTPLTMSDANVDYIFDC